MNRQQRRAAARQGAGAVSGTAPSTPATSRAARAFASGLEAHKAGRFPEAEALYRQALAADARHADSLNFLGVLALQSDRAEEAAVLIGRALALAPETPAYHYNAAMAARSLGHLEDAATHLRHAVRLQPGHQGAHNNLGRVLHELGRLEEAAAAYAAALALGADPRVLCNLGNLRLEQGALDEAASCHDRARLLAPSMPEAHNGVGSVLLRRSRPAEAAAAFRRAVALRPDFAEAHANLARALLSQGDPDGASAAAQRALAEAESADTRALFAACVADASLRSHPGNLDALLLRALVERWGRPADLARACVRALLRRSPVAECVARLETAGFVGLDEQAPFGTGDAAAVAKDPLLLALMEAAPIPDRGIEAFLTAARSVLLRLACRASEAGASAEPAESDTGALAFWCALAQQCFATEYVFDCSRDEQGRARHLLGRLTAATDTDAPVSPILPVAVAAYLPLAQMPGAERLLHRPWPDAVGAVLRRQVAEPLEERRLRDAIQRLTPVEQEVSRAVQRQYEENPYPRWTAAASPPTGQTTPDAYMAGLFPHARPGVPGRDGGHDVLVAGCGTGQQPIEIARRHGGSVRILAVDLSLASLAYARRQTAALGIEGIEYAQADLLRLGALGRVFDVVEASGVLHHLADPWQGWRTLVSLLRPGGVMHLGLYSALARQDVVAARAWIAERGFPPTPDGIRRCRREMAEAEEGTPLRRLSRSSDFCSTSGCRDLLFHVQEHRLTLPEIRAFLDAEGLEFLGFDLQPSLAQAYGQRHPEDRAMTDLGRWDQFERAHPDAFAAMYQFWIRKP